MQHKIILITIIIIFSILATSAQEFGHSKWSKKDHQKFKSAQTLHKAKQANQALKVYCKLLNKYAGHPDLELWAGLAYKDIGKNEEALEHLLLSASNSNIENSLLFSTIGTLYKEAKKYDEASEYFMQYLTIADITLRGYQQVKRLYEESKFAAHQINNPVPFNPIPLGNSVNTLAVEYLLQFTADHSILYFTRRIRGQEDIFYVEKTNEGYSKSKAFDVVNSDRHDEGAHTISADGNSFIFTHHDDKYGMGGHDLYITTKNNNEWERPKNMGRTINSVHWDSQPSLSGDGNILFFSSNRQGGYGGRDIWYSVFGKDGYWSPPRNAGDVINTSGDESSPFLHADMRTLYFRSNGHVGMGNFDLFVARRQKGGSWSEIENLGYPINTEGQEGALTVSLDGTKAYFATDNKNGEIQDNLDIYEFILPSDKRPLPCTYIKIRSIDDQTSFPVNSTLQIIDIESNTIISTKKVNLNGEALIPIPMRQKIMINVSAPDYMFYSDNILLDSVSHGLSPYERTINLQKIKNFKFSEEERTFVLKNIFFKSGTALLEEVSLNEIKRLADILKDNSENKLRIIGHTDDIGSEKDNLELSKQRAVAVKNALIGLGILENRITTIGKGESEPIVNNETEDSRLLNRRTEFVLY